MNDTHARPKWYGLYLLFGLFVGALWLESNLALSDPVHKWAETGLVVLFFGCVFSWVDANELAIMQEDWQHNKKTDR